MEHLRKFQKSVARSVLSHIGVTPYWERAFSSSVKSAAYSSDIQRLPVSTKMPPIQNQNGVLLFMAGFSDAGGTDPVSR